MPRNNPRFLIVHCTDVSRAVAGVQFDAVNRYHRDERQFPVSSLGYYVGYHFLIEESGQAIRARADSDEGAHCNQVDNGVSLNLQSIGICMAGDFDIEHPTDAQVETLKRLIADYCATYGIPPERVTFHRRWAISKTCPGSLLNDEWLRMIVGQGTPKDDPEQLRKQAEITRLQHTLLDYLLAFLRKLQAELAQRSLPSTPQ